SNPCRQRERARQRSWMWFLQTGVQSQIIRTTVAELDARSWGVQRFVGMFRRFLRGAAVASARLVAEQRSDTVVRNERRGAQTTDRRKRSRSGRRGTDP